MSRPPRRRIPAPVEVHVHTCHWPGCNVAVPPKMWGCKRHWFLLPRVLRAKVWAAYVPGQEITKTPSPTYLKVAQEVQAWIAKYEGRSRREEWDIGR